MNLLDQAVSLKLVSLFEANIAISSIEFHLTGFRTGFSPEMMIFFL